MVVVLTGILGEAIFFAPAVLDRGDPTLVFENVKPNFGLVGRLLWGDGGHCNAPHE
jgi:hypothetical protein